MARSFETGTLLSKLGFDDSDRKNDLHDIACHYLAQDKFSKAMLDASQFLWAGQRQFRHERTCEVVREEFKRTHSSSIAPVFEFHVKKGEGKYSTTVGFADVILRYKINEIIVEDGTTNNFHVAVPVEVKIGRCSISDAIRQILLYREHVGIHHCSHDGVRSFFSWWVLATHFEITEEELRHLNLSRIGHVQLGDGLLEYAKESRKKMAESRVL